MIIYRQSSIIGIYVSSSGYFFVIDYSANLILIINVNTRRSVIFSYTTGVGYYLEVKQYDREQIIEYLRNTTSLSQAWEYYKTNGKRFQITAIGIIQGSSEASVVVEEFSVAFFGARRYTLVAWRLRIVRIYVSATYIFYIRGVVYEVQVSSYIEFIRFLIAYQSDGGSDSSTEAPSGSDESRSGGHEKGEFRLF